MGDLAQEPLGLLPRRFRGPGRAVPANRVPALAAFLCPIEQHVGDGVALLAPRAEARQARRPRSFVRA